MGLFRRTPKGRHALGAAVTSIPSGPLRVAAPQAVAVQQQPPPPPVVEAAPAESSVMSSISELISSGEAWASDLEDVHALHTPPVRPAALSLAVAQPPAPTQASAPRVQLGFRDGTSAALDPESEQALALELLAQSLTRRD